MSKVGFVDVDPATEDLFFSNLQPGDRFGFSRLRRKVTLYSRQKIAGLTQKSMLPQISALWENLTAEEKEAWTAAGDECGLNGWRLCVQDTCLRIKNELAGLATPSTLHQGMVGYVLVAAPATSIKIAQYHPRSYFVLQKKPGTKSQYEPVKVTEDIALPISISLNYKSDLASQGDGAFAKFYITVRSSYQGIDRFANAEISIDLSAAWKNATASISSCLGYVIGYTAYIEFYNLRGTLLVDNMKIEHSGQNWCRDPYCKDLNQGFTRAFYQIPKHWVSVEMPDGSEFGSIYPT